MNAINLIDGWIGLQAELCDCILTMGIASWSLVIRMWLRSSSFGWRNAGLLTLQF